jgi:ferredoxin like protein
MIIEDRIAQIRYVLDAKTPHIIINNTICKNCSSKPCLYVCPVQNYRLDEEGRVTFSWEACVECGACRLVCEADAISWNYPRGGFGICYRYG